MASSAGLRTALRLSENNAYGLVPPNPGRRRRPLGAGMKKRKDVISIACIDSVDAIAPRTPRRKMKKLRRKKYRPKVVGFGKATPETRGIQKPTTPERLELNSRKGEELETPTDCNILVEAYTSPNIDSFDQQDETKARRRLNFNPHDKVVMHENQESQVNVFNDTRCFQYVYKRRRTTQTQIKETHVECSSSLGCPQEFVGEGNLDYPLESSNKVQESLAKAILPFENTSGTGSSPKSEVDNVDDPTNGADIDKQLEEERKILHESVKQFISNMRSILGGRQISLWKGSVVDSVVGVFLTQNVTDVGSSSAFMDLAAKFRLPSSDMNAGQAPKLNLSGEEKSLNQELIRVKKTRKRKLDSLKWDGLRKSALETCIEMERTSYQMDTVDWEAVRNQSIEQISDSIKQRGMQNNIGQRIKKFLNRLVRDHKSIDLEWLRHVRPEEAQKYLRSIEGIGLKSTECVRLLTLQQRAFPVDTNVARICVRLGWVPLEPLPDSVMFHKLEIYPKPDTIQKYLWLRLCSLDHQTLAELHYQMIIFGKVFCTKLNPNCNQCPMRRHCAHFASASSRSLVLDTPEAKHTEPPLTDIEDCICGESDQSSIRNLDLQDGEASVALVDTSIDVAAPSPVRSIEIGSHLRTMHQVFELPDSHPLLELMYKREPDDPCPYLLAIWNPGDISRSDDQSGTCCSEFCDKNLCTAADDVLEAGNQTVKGTVLIPCRTALGGCFPLSGTYFPANEVFADHHSSYEPIDVQRNLLCNLQERTLYCGTSLQRISTGLAEESVKRCFRDGFVCIKGFDPKTRVTMPLHPRFHITAKSPNRIVKARQRKGIAAKKKVSHPEQRLDFV